MNHGTLRLNLNIGTGFVGSCKRWPTDHGWPIERKKAALFLTAIYLKTLTEFTKFQLTQAEGTNVFEYDRFGKHKK